MRNLSSDDYVRERIHPQPGDSHYVHLSDLKMSLEQVIKRSAGSVLDYGCGGSPYRSMFDGRYTRADIASNPERDVLVDNCGRLACGLQEFDLVFSSQVLEHVTDPELYLSECFRVLKRGGTLVVTTHGIFFDHPCPNDYWRWTADGLAAIVHRQGFAIEKVLKTTCGTRALLYLWEKGGRTPRLQPFESVAEIWLGFVLRALCRLRGRRLHTVLDRWFEAERVRLASRNDRDLYIGITLLAKKE